jgi:hypothetical protein
VTTVVVIIIIIIIIMPLIRFFLRVYNTVNIFVFCRCISLLVETCSHGICQLSEIIAYGIGRVVLTAV